MIECVVCGLVATYPRPVNEKLSLYYQSDDYISHSGRSNNLINSLYIQARKVSLNWKIQLVKSLTEKGNLLDVGCGTGEFLHAMKNNGWAVEGVEPNKTARQKAESLIGQPVSESIENSTSAAFDVITLWHVLEHLPDLNESLKKISNLLKPTGTLIIAVPNHNSDDAKQYREYWAGYDVPRHLWHFGKKEMVLFLQNHGFRLFKIKPMKLDAYYVSLLSEKYKHTGKTTLMTLIKGFWNGLLSNRQAKKTGEYSSLIYIAKR